MLSQRAVEYYLDSSHCGDDWDYAIFYGESTQISSVDRVDSTIDYEKFFRDYMLPNKPCVFQSTHTSDWKSRKDWVIPEGSPNLKYLREHFGETVASVADCETWEYDSQKKQDMLLSEYINYWISLKNCQSKKPCLYLKDWHFYRLFPTYGAYITPEYFSSDWLNEFCCLEDDDYKFVYMGPKGTWTPFHADVFGSYSWSANVCGRKRWILFPPGTEKQVSKAVKKGSFEVDSASASLGIEVIQEPGEMIFVPSGWHHQVWNLDDVISINHNWFNGCNISYIWKCLTLAADKVTSELSDIKDADDWEEQCQMMLRLHHGMNYSDFLRLLHFVIYSRIETLKLSTCNYRYWHWVFDIASIKNVLTVMTHSSLSSNYLSDIKTMIEKIEDYMYFLKLF